MTDYETMKLVASVSRKLGETQAMLATAITMLNAAAAHLDTATGDPELDGEMRQHKRDIQRFTDEASAALEAKDE